MTPAVQIGDCYGRTVSGVANLLALMWLVGGTAFAATPEADPVSEELKRADALENEAGSFFASGQYAEAEVSIRESLDLRRAALGDKDLGVVSSLNALAMVLQAQGDYNGARPAFEEALEISRAELGENHADTASALAQLAGLLQDLGEYDRAEELYERSLATMRATLGADHPDVTVAVNNLGTLRYQQGDYTGARPLLEESVSRLRAELGAEHTDVAIALNNLAGLLKVLGDFEGARPLYEQSIAILRRELGDDHPVISTLLGNLGLLLAAQRNYVGAKPLFEESLAIRRAQLGDDHPSVADSLTNLGFLLSKQDDYAAAQALYEQSLAIRVAAHGDDHQTVANALDHLAGVLNDQGDHAAARPLLERSLAIKRRTLGDAHPFVANTLSELADAHRALGEYSSALPKSVEAIAIWRNAVGDSHLDTARSLANHSYIQLQSGDIEGARASLEESLAIWTDRLDLLDALSDREGAAYLFEARGVLSLWLSLFDRAEDAPPAWVNVLQWKGAGTRSLTVRAAASRASRDPATSSSWEALSATRSELARLVYADFDPDRAGARDLEIRELTAKKEAQERALAKSEVSLEKPNIEAICQRLPRDAAIVDFLRYRTMDEEVLYLAFVVRPDCSVTRVELGPAAPLDALVHGWRRTLARGDLRARVRGRRVAATLWQELQPHLDGAERLWIVPDGDLSGLPWAALPLDDGRFLLEDREVHVLSSAAKLLAPAVDRGEGLLTVGGVDYSRSATPPCVEGEFQPLPGTAEESEALVHLWRRRHRSEVETLRGAEATESAVVSKVSGKRVVHLATHGFFAGGECSSSLDDGGFNPMLLSGLALAGDPHQTPGAPEDGILTAEEIAGLDLRGTELVLLSACETALGDTSRSGEGVLGLQRGFAIAGAESVVMSLWSVPDAQTATLMKTLTSQLARRRPASPATALREAQLALLHHNRDEYGLPLPHTWAAWVVSGSGWQ